MNGDDTVLPGSRECCGAARLRVGKPFRDLKPELVRVCSTLPAAASPATPGVRPNASIMVTCHAPRDCCRSPRQREAAAGTHLSSATHVPTLSPHLCEENGRHCIQHAKQTGATTASLPCREVADHRSRPVLTPSFSVQYWGWIVRVTVPNKHGPHHHPRAFRSEKRCGAFGGAERTAGSRWHWAPGRSAMSIELFPRCLSGRRVSLMCLWTLHSRQRKSPCSTRTPRYASSSASARGSDPRGRAAEWVSGAGITWVELGLPTGPPSGVERTL